MSSEFILLDPARCNGCGDCVAACATRRRGLESPKYSCIQIASDPLIEGFYLPVLCLQCTDPPCMKVCPNGSIFRDDALNRVMIKSHDCIGCKMCYSVCPFGAMGFDEGRGTAFKCDLCGGDPECVRICEPMALVLVRSDELEAERIRGSAKKFFGAALT